MQLELEKGIGNTIRSLSREGLCINNEVLHCNVIVSVDRIVRDWAPPPIAKLSIADFSPILALDPEVVLLGTGNDQAFADARLMTEVMRQGVGLEVMTTSAACRTFNVLMSEQRRVVAALILDVDR